MKILDDLVAGLEVDAPVREVRIGPFWTAVWSRFCGLASTVVPGKHQHGSTLVDTPGRLTAGSALDLAHLAFSESSLETGVGLAAINSLLEVDESRCTDLNAGRFLVEHGHSKRVALVGHFPFVPDLREAAGKLWVVEQEPQPGDVTAEEGDALIGLADIVAITGSAFINHTIEHLLSCCRPESLVMVLGPSAPLSPVLFDYGVDVISGTRVTDPEQALRGLSEGAIFQQMRGVRLLTLQRQNVGS
jgi:uncharacterized protein (DUF4213/DUF364 family)